jgi:hypothetical protein
VKILTSVLLSLLFATRPGIKMRTPQESMARTMLMNFTAGRFDAARKDFNDTLLKTVTSAMLTDLKQQFDTEAGTFQFVSNVREGRDDDQFRFAELTARYEKSSVIVRVVFDQANKIGGVFFNRVVPEKVDPALEAAARELLTAFVQGRFADVGKDFTPKFAAQLPPAGLENLRRQIGETYGTFRGVIAVGQATEKEYRILNLTAMYDRKVSVVVVFDAAGKVNGLRFSPGR